MLTYNALIEQAKIREMPPTKIRGILREYIQILLLKELYRNEAGKKLYFTGGTYLHLVHNLKRFSEDLDFNTENIKQAEFENLVQKIKTELKRINIVCQIKFKHWKNIYCADLVFPHIEQAYKATSKFSQKKGIIIKIETNRPKWKIRKEIQVISGFGEVYPCICTDKSALFADKIDAFNKKDRARHIYDIMFMLSNKFPIDTKILESLGWQGDPLETILKRIKAFTKIELKKQAEALRPFLFKEDEADLIINAHNIIPALVEKYTGLLYEDEKIIL